MSDLSRLTLRDILYSVASTGGTINTMSTATDILRAVVTESSTEIPFSSTAITYDISGYTIASSIEGATYYEFYVNTGATLVTLTTGDTLLNTYISGSTAVPSSGITVTEIFTYASGTTTQVNNYLNVQVSGITAASGGTSDPNPAFTSIYIPDKTSQKSWRIEASGDDLIFSTLSGATWVEKGKFLGA